jgi:glycosyltransferase involved in cell wall biosynthesis
MAAPLSILVLCYEYPPIGGGGGRVAQTVAEALAARGHAIAVQTAALGWRSLCEEIGGVAVHRAGSGRRAPDTCRVHEMAGYCATSFLPALARIRQRRPGVMHAHFAMPTGLLAWALHRITKVPYILTAHLGDVPGGVPEQTDRLFRIVTPLARCVWHEAAAATAVSSFVQKLAERAYGGKVERVLNGIALGGVPPVRPPGPTRQLVFAGRFNPQKKPDFLIEIMARLKAHAWHLTMIGDGPLMPEVRRMIEGAGLAGRVSLPGWLAPEEVAAAFARSDLLLLPSSSEGLPIAAIEALKYGLAIASSDIPGVSDVVEHERNGLRLPVGNLDAWVERLRWLIDSADAMLSMKNASRAMVRAFDLESIASQYERILAAAARRPCTVPHRR